MSTKASEPTGFAVVDEVIHVSRDGRALCGAHPEELEPFRAIPIHRGTHKATCMACLRVVEHGPTNAVTGTCPICGNESKGGVETNYVCDGCWSTASVAFSMSTAGPESHANFGASMDVARLAAAIARREALRSLSRERMTRFWQSIQWFAFAASIMKNVVRVPILFRWAEDRNRRLLSAGDDHIVE